MKKLFLVTLFIFISLSCSKKNKIDIEHATFGPEDTWFAEPNQTQTPDSIIIYTVRDTITPAGDSMYIMSTKFDKRIIDNIVERDKNSPNPTRFTVIGNVYRLEKKGEFSITAFDTNGTEFMKLIKKELPRGEYKVNNSVYSTLPGGRYYLEIIFNDKKLLKRIAVG